MAQMQPRDLTNLFEHISGSAQYRQVTRPLALPLRVPLFALIGEAAGRLAPHLRSPAAAAACPTAPALTLTAGAPPRPFPTPTPSTLHPRHTPSAPSTPTPTPARKHIYTCTFPATHTPLTQEYEELEKKKAEAEERVSYIFSRKKAITQGARGRAAGSQRAPQLAHAGWLTVGL